jgi:protein phosphatase
MQTEGVDYSQIAAEFNQLLIEQSSRLPLRLQVYSATDVGRARSHNEDSCYPLALNAPAFDDLAPRLMIVCDGIGGHEGGEVASQLAIQAIQLQVRALLAEVAGQPQTVPPELMCEQIAAIVRVVNNLIAAQNDAQSREARRRMGTTLVMALQIPQAVTLPGGSVSINANELYIANVGDSRAYWITPDYCHQLTVDDDVAVREVRMGRSLYREALKQPSSGALTQALGTRDGSHLYPSVQRFILEEDGILLLCSDGLSDNGFVEQSWSDYADLILRDRFPLETAVQSWLEFANQRNGHDNISIVLAHCQVSPAMPAMQVSIASPTPLEADEDELPAPVIIPTAAEVEQPRRKKSGWLKSVLFLLLLTGAVGGAGAWYYVDPAGVQRFKTEVKTQFDALQKRIPTDFLKR